MKIFVFSKEYSKSVAKVIEKKISIRKKQNIILTGGNTVKEIYRNININKINIKNSYYFSDERCVSKLSVRSNFYNLSQNLFKDKKNLFNVHRIHTYKKNKNSVINSYTRSLPKKFELLFLTLGDDGHLASIFQTKDSKLNSLYFFTKNKFLNRISIGKKIIKRVKEIIIVVKGKQKGKILNDYINSKIKIKKNYPLSLFHNSSLFLDRKAFNQLTKKNKTIY